MTSGRLIPGPGRRWIAPGLIALVIVSCIVVVVLLPAAAENAGFVGLTAGMAGAGTFMLVRSKNLERRERGVWRTLGVAPLIIAAGLVFTAVLTLAGVEIPAIGPSDVFFLAGYLLLIVTVIRFAKLESGGREWLPTIIDGLVGGISLAVLVWTFIFDDLVEALSGTPWWQVMIGAAYPVLDVAVIVSLIIMIIKRSHFHLDMRLLLLAGGLSIQVVSDLVYLHRNAGLSFAQARPTWLLLLPAALLIMLAGSIVDVTPKKREFPEVDVPLWALVWPYLLAAALLSVHVGIYSATRPGFDATLVLDAVLAVGILVFCRQLLAIRHNQHRVERQRSELVASVSHELRTPLTAIVGYLQLLVSGDDFPEEARREMLAEASEQAEHMSLLVSDLVMLARGVHRNLPLDITEVAVSSVLHAALRGIDPKGKSIEVEAVEARAHIDPDRIQQALSNLLSNAIKYGGDRAHLSARVEGTDLIFEMHDNGTGVPTRYEALIWQRFERGANRLNAATPGLGIGLAIVEAIATSHGGTASYRRSEKLGGACFSIVIPGCVATDTVVPDLADAKH